MNIITFILFPFFFVPAIVMVRKVFGHGQFMYAGCVMALASSFITASLLSDPIGFLGFALSGGLIATSMVILFACFCLIPVGVFFCLFVVGLRDRFRINAITNHFEHLIPENPGPEPWIPENPAGAEWIPDARHETDRDNLGISEGGRQQISRLIRTKKSDEEQKEEHGYINISSEYRDD